MPLRVERRLEALLQVSDPSLPGLCNGRIEQGCALGQNPRKLIESLGRLRCGFPRLGQLVLDPRSFVEGSPVCAPRPLHRLGHEVLEGGGCLGTNQPRATAACQRRDLLIERDLERGPALFLGHGHLERLRLPHPQETEQPGRIAIAKLQGQFVGFLAACRDPPCSKVRHQGLWLAQVLLAQSP